MNLVPRQQIAAGTTRTDGDLGEVAFEGDASQAGDRLQRDLDDLCLPVRVDREVDHFRVRLAVGAVIFAVAYDAGDEEALDHVVALGAVPVDHVVDGALVVLLEDIDVYEVRPHEHLVGDADNLVLARAVEEDDVVDVRAVRHELILLQTRAYEALVAVDVQLLVRLHHLGSLDGVEAAYFGEAGMVLAVLLLEHPEPARGDLDHVAQFLVYFGYLLVHACDGLVRLVAVELEDASHLYFHQAEDVVLRHFTDELRVEGGQTLVDVCAGGIHVLRLFERTVLVDALLNEYLLEGGEVQAFLQLSLAYLQFAPQQVEGVVHRLAQHVAHTEEVGLLVVDDAAVGRDVHLAVCAGIERVERLVRRHARCQVDEYLGMCRRVVLHLPYLDFALLHCLEDGVYQGRSGLAIGNFRDDERLVVQLVDFRTDFHAAAPFAVVVPRHVDGTARLEVRIEVERLAVQVGYGGVAQLIEVVGQYLR
ncbi:unknown [Bacteroides sp. CAG:462]|nr:unknown [Bacteroides sp. CAG:462]